MAPLETVLLHSVEERTGADAFFCDAGQMVEIPSRKVGRIQALGRVNTKTPNTELTAQPSRVWIRKSLVKAT